METFYKPLTSTLRSDITVGIHKNMTELNACQPNALATAQKIGLIQLEKLMNALPDGYPIPLERRNGGRRSGRTRRPLRRGCDNRI